MAFNLASAFHYYYYSFSISYSNPAPMALTPAGGPRPLPAALTASDAQNSSFPTCGLDLICCTSPISPAGAAFQRDVLTEL